MGGLSGWARRLGPRSLSTVPRSGAGKPLRCSVYTVRALLRKPVPGKIRGRRGSERGTLGSPLYPTGIFIGARAPAVVDVWLARGVQGGRFPRSGRHARSGVVTDVWQAGLVGGPPKHFTSGNLFCRWGQFGPGSVPKSENLKFTD